MLCEERLDLVFVDGTHLLWGDSDLIPVPITPLASKLVHPLDIWEAVVDNAKRVQVIDTDCVARIVRQTLVALFICKCPFLKYVDLNVAGLSYLDVVVKVGPHGNKARYVIGNEKSEASLKT